MITLEKISAILRQNPQPEISPQDDPAERLGVLRGLLEQRLITEAEFEARKKEIIAEV